jgi:hypothetical protein
MNKSDTIASLSKALVLAQAEFKSVTMNSVNPFFKSKYADLGAVIETCKPILSKHGLAVSQLAEGADGQAGVTTMLIHESGEYISTSLVVPIAGGNISQEAGKTITYLRRYGLAAILGLYADEDTDAEGSHKDQPKQDQKAPEKKTGKLIIPDKPTTSDYWQITRVQLKWTEQKAKELLADCENNHEKAIQEILKSTEAK